MFIPIYDDNPLRSIRHPWVTFALIGVNALVLLLQATDWGLTHIVDFALVPAELFGAPLSAVAGRGAAASVAPEIVTPLTHIFFHGDLIHLATNMSFLWVFGDNVEDALGHRRYFLFYLACGIASGLAHAAAMPASPLPLIGASGAVSGVIAAYLMLHPRVQVWILALRVIPLRVSAGVALGLWAATQVIMLLFAPDGPIAWWAHVGGLAVGALLIVFLRKPGYPLFDQRVKAAMAARGNRG